MQANKSRKRAMIKHQNVKTHAAIESMTQIAAGRPLDVASTGIHPVGTVAGIMQRLEELACAANLVLNKTTAIRDGLLGGRLSTGDSNEPKLGHSMGIFESIEVRVSEIHSVFVEVDEYLDTIQNRISTSR